MMRRKDDPALTGHRSVTLRDNGLQQLIARENEYSFASGGQAMLEQILELKCS